MEPTNQTPEVKIMCPRCRKDIPLPPQVLKNLKEFRSLPAEPKLDALNKSLTDLIEKVSTLETNIQVVLDKLPEA